MRAVLLQEQKKPLVMSEIPKPRPKDHEILIKVNACGVCRTDLHIKDADLPLQKLPLVLGHEIVGVVEESGRLVKELKRGDRVGVPWLGKSCGLCEHCKQDQENLCEEAQFTGYDIDGGFAEYAVCDADFAILLPPGLDDLHVAPLICAGLIGFRSYRKAAPKKTLGLYGFGVAAHLVIQIAVREGKEVYAFTRDGDQQGQDFAKKLGAVWAGGSTTPSPTPLDAVIIFAPVGDLVPIALNALKKGGHCICGGIHMSDIPSFPYRTLWGEKSLQSVANLTRQDAIDFFAIIAKFPIQTFITVYPLEKADQALEDFKQSKIQGAAVIDISKKLY